MVCLGLRPVIRAGQGTERGGEGFIFSRAIFSPRRISRGTIFSRDL